MIVDRMHRRQRALTCQLSLREIGKRNTVQPNVQGQDGGSTLTDRLVIPRHVTPGNTGEPLFHSSFCRSYARTVQPHHKFRPRTLANHAPSFHSRSLPNSSFHPSNTSSNGLLDRHREGS